MAVTKTPQVFYIGLNNLKIKHGRKIYLSSFVNLIFGLEVYYAVEDILYYWVNPTEIANHLRSCLWTEYLQKTFGKIRAEELEQQLDEIQYTIDTMLTRPLEHPIR